MKRQTWQLTIVTIALVVAGWPTWAQTVTRVFEKVRILSTATDALVVNGGVRVTQAATTGGPAVIIDSSFVSGGDYMSSVLFQLDGVNVSRIGSYEFLADQYGIGFWTHPGGTATEALRITQSGEITAVRQPGFLAYNSATDTAVGDLSTIDVDTEVYDEANSFTADTFTAPVTGRYLFCGEVDISDNDPTDIAYANIVTSNRTYRIAKGLGNWSLGNCVPADMDTGDSASLQIDIAVAVTVDVNGGASPIVTYFSGRLIP